jgi:hypothetical protein
VLQSEASETLDIGRQSQLRKVSHAKCSARFPGRGRAHRHGHRRSVQ